MVLCYLIKGKYSLEEGELYEHNQNYAMSGYERRPSR